MLHENYFEYPRILASTFSCGHAIIQILNSLNQVGLTNPDQSYCKCIGLTQIITIFFTNWSVLLKKIPKILILVRCYIY